MLYCMPFAGESADFCAPLREQISDNMKIVTSSGKSGQKTTKIYLYRIKGIDCVVKVVIRWILI